MRGAVPRAAQFVVIRAAHGSFQSLAPQRHWTHGSWGGRTASRRASAHVSSLRSPRQACRRTRGPISGTRRRSRTRRARAGSRSAPLDVCHQCHRPTSPVHPSPYTSPSKPSDVLYRPERVPVRSEWGADPTRRRPTRPRHGANDTTAPDPSSGSLGTKPQNGV